jgi:hypothetical protein
MYEGLCVVEVRGEGCFFFLFCVPIEGKFERTVYNPL